MVSINTARLNNKKERVLFSHFINFSFHSSTNSDYFPVQCQVIGFITETECVYCAVRTGYLIIILRSAHTAVFMCFLWISEQTAIISLYNINRLVCITETQCVYCAVRTGSLTVIPR